MLISTHFYGQEKTYLGLSHLLEFWSVRKKTEEEEEVQLNNIDGWMAQKS